MRRSIPASNDVLRGDGHDVEFLARCEHLRAIQRRGLEIQSAQFGTFVWL